MVEEATEATPQSAEADGGFKPPYISWKTFEGFIAKFGEKAPPPRIDKGFLDNYAGSVQALLLATLKTFDLIEDDGKVLPVLVEISRDEDQRKKVIGAKVQELYPELVQLALDNGTNEQLKDWFGRFRYNGSTLYKAVQFYLQASEYAGLPKSEHFKPPRMPKRPSGASRKTAPKNNTKQEPEANVPPADPPPGNRQGEVVEINLGPGGRVRLDVDVRWLQLPDDTFLALRKLIKDMEALSASVGSEAPAAESANNTGAEEDEIIDWDDHEEVG